MADATVIRRDPWVQEIQHKHRLVSAWPRRHGSHVLLDHCGNKPCRAQRMVLSSPLPAASVKAEHAILKPPINACGNTAPRTLKIWCHDRCCTREIGWMGHSKDDGPFARARVGSRSSRRSCRPREKNPHFATRVETPTLVVLGMWLLRLVSRRNASQPPENITRSLDGRSFPSTGLDWPFGNYFPACRGRPWAFEVVATSSL